MSSDLTWSRRTILRGAASVGAGVLAGGLGSGPDAALAQTAPATADEALKRLLDGNQRFMVRVAGNVAGAEETASLEFGTLVLGAKVLVVLGHSGCGAVKAALEGGDAPGQISTLYRLIGPGIDRQNKNLDVAIASNVRAQARVLRKGSTVIAGLIRDGKLKLAGGVYDLTSGKVTMMEV